uniref:Protein SZT2 n=1 Tax=Schizaphis graminum TaxID=13262 RepID=A0A2S2NRV9_SCHGA
MEETDDWDNNSNCSSLITSSTDSDCGSVLSVILNPTQTKDDGPETFTYAAPLPVGSYALASCVYVLIDKGRSMSADMRVMWYLKRLGTIQMVDDDLDVESPEQCKIMSFIPREENLDKDGFANSIFVMDAYTRVYFLTAVYNMVYCLDMSPSNCSVDIQRCHVMLDEMIVALRRSIEGFIRPFIVPGSDKIVFEPQVYVTVIVHTPFYTSPAQQVLVQGWLINNRNFQEFIKTITTEMNRLENSLAMTKKTIRKPKHFIDENQSSNTPVSDDSNPNHHNLINNDSNVRPTFNNNPDSGFINTLRYGMLAVRLLPQSSISNLIVITDGMITLADIQVLDSVLNQLRCISVACSFLHVSSQFHPHSGHGNVPYSELMQLIATATSGTYLNSFPKTTPNLVVNFYHDKFIMWSFKRGDNESSNNTTNLSCTPPRVRPGEWIVRNSNFYGNRQTQLVTKKQFSDHIQANLDNVVCCRLREGFIIEDIQFKDAGSSTVVPYMNNSSKLQLKLILPWTNHIYIEYDITVKWPPSVKKKIVPIVIEEKPELVEPSTSTSQPPASIQLDSLNIYYTVSVKGPYEFLHDITCTRTKKSQLLSKIPRQCQFHLSSCRSSSISVATASTTITRNLNLLTDRSYSSLEKKVSSKYRQALITRFWSTMQSIAQTDLLIKHLEAYSPSTGHLMNSENFNQPIEQNETQDKQFQKQKNQQTVQIEPTSQVIQNLQVLETPQILQLDDSSVISSNLNSNNSKTDTVFSTEKTEANLLSFLTSEVPNKSPLHNGVPLFYYLVTNSNTSFCLKQNQFKTDDQQQSYTDQQHQRFVDFWKPVCTLDPDTQWPKWFSTYRIGGGVLLLRHDRPLPQWFYKENMDIDNYQTLTCNKSSVALYTLLKQWCTFVLIDEHSYVKCLDQSETYTDDVSFCIARVSPRPPSCCCVVLHLAFQSCVPASVHHKIMNDLKKNIELLDSTTAVEQFSFEDNNQITEDQENNKKKVKTITIEESLALNKPSKHQRYVYLMDKPLEKILIRYERIPSEFTTVIFPDGSQPSSAITTINIQKSRSKLNIGLPHDTVHESSTGVESKPVSTTTTLSRYLYHKRWIWSSGCSRYSQCSNSVSQKLQLQLQLARTLSVLTRIRLREGFKFAHSSAGIINMVLEVDMIEGSPHCPSTPTSHCVIQYVLFPPNKLQKQQPKTYEYNSVFDKLNMENNDDESSSIMSVEEQQKFDKRQKQGRHIVSFAGDNNDCCSKHKMEDEYQLITECWIEPQHGTVVVNEKQNYNYMSGLMYEQLADATSILCV